jgi:hypothetical protein
MSQIRDHLDCLWGAQAASLSAAAACREQNAASFKTRAADFGKAPLRPSGKLPDSAGWQPALSKPNNSRRKAQTLQL